MVLLFATRFKQLCFGGLAKRSKLRKCVKCSKFARENTIIKCHRLFGTDMGSFGTFGHKTSRFHWQK